MKTQDIVRQLLGGMHLSVLPACVVASGLMLATPARALVTSGTSDSYGLRGDVDIVGGLISTSLGAGTYSGSAPAPYSSSSSGIALNPNIGASVNLGLGIGVVDVTAVNATGIFNSTISSNVDGGGGSRTTSAFTQITGSGGPFNLTVGDTQALVLNPAALLTLSATAIESTSTVMGDYGGFTGSGSSVITNFGLSLNGGSTIDLTSLLTGAGYTLNTDFLANGTILTPNLSVDLTALGLAGASLVFNRQVSTGDGVTSLDFETTAIYLDVNSTLPLLGDTLDTQIAIGQSAAGQGGISAVPEPGSALLFALGVVTLLGHRRRFSRSIP